MNRSIPESGRKRPSVSIALVVFQQQDFVESAVRSVLSQNCEPAEILICDDCSTDATFELVTRECQAYDGAHQVRYWRRSKNAGPGNLQQLLPETTGDFVVVAHGDDIAMPERVSRLTRTLEETGRRSSRRMPSSSTKTVWPNINRWTKPRTDSCPVTAFFTRGTNGCTAQHLLFDALYSKHFRH